MNPRTLFQKRSVLDELNRLPDVILADINSYDGNKLLNTSTDDLAAYFVSQYSMSIPEILEDSIVVDQAETQVDVRHDPMRFVIDSSRPAYVPGVLFTLVVPFTGEASYFDMQPRSFSLGGGPRGEVTGQELRLFYQAPNDTVDQSTIKTSLDRALAEVRQNLKNLEDEAALFNDSLPGLARTHIENRKKRLLENAGLAANLGFPLRRRAEGTTFAAPEVRKKAIFVPPQAGTAPYTPEPILAQEEYENIIRLTCRSMEVLERSPKAFMKMGEEDLRTQILVMLNAHYEGQATGETFNYGGKTDILVRSGSGNVFVGECKFWTGPKAFLDTIDQLLGYVTWRDTKAMVVIFNRNKGFTEMLEGMGQTLPTHKHYKRKAGSDGPANELRCVLGHPDDTQREIYLTVLAFDVPR